MNANLIRVIESKSSTQTAVESLRDSEVKSLIGDLAEFAAAGNYAKATQVAAHLLVTLAIKANAKPFTVLRAVYPGYRKAA